MKNTDHQLTKRDADILKGVALLPLDLRIESLRKLVLNDRGSDGLLLLFASFIGLANQVCESTHEFLQTALIPEFKEWPATARRLNLPDIFGALCGIEVAMPYVKGMCQGCAFRQGTAANQCMQTSIDAKNAAEGDLTTFYCHEKPGAKHLCAGYMATQEQTKVMA